MKRVLKSSLALMMAALTQAPAFAYYQSNLQAFGGNGQDSAVTLSGTDTTTRLVDATVFTVSGTWGAVHGSRVNSQGPVTISGTINVGASIIGPPSSVSPLAALGSNTQGINNPGGGPGGGYSSDSSYNGGNGAGFGGKGGRAGALDAGGTMRYHNGGASYSPFSFAGGSAGGSGKYNEGFNNGTGGAGGNAGGSICIYSGRTISVSGQINANGGNGGNAIDAGQGCSGGGGGSGGLVVLAAMQSITLSSSNAVQVIGGNGGNGTNSTGSAGGGGGGGWIVLIAPTVTISGSVNTAGGTKGGSTGTVYPPGDGSAGQTLTIQRIPSLPILSLLQRTDFVDFVASKHQGQKHISLSSENLDQLISAFKSKRA